MKKRGLPTSALFQAGFFGLLLRGSGVLAALAAQLLIARIMQLEAFGVYVTILAWTAVLSPFGGCGMPLSAVRFLPLYRARGDGRLFRGFLHTAWHVVLVSSIAISLGFIAVFFAVPSLRPQAEAAVIGAPLIVLLGLIGLGTACLQALQFPLRAEAIANLSRSLMIALLVGGAGWIAGPLDVFSALSLTAIALAVVAQAALMTLGRVLRGSADTGRSFADRAMWIASGLAFLVPMAAISMIERVDTIMVSALIGPQEAGIYNVASRFALLVGFALASVNALVGPMSADLLARRDFVRLQRVLGNGALLASGLGIFVAAMLLLLGPFLLRLFGSSFSLGFPALAILTGGQLVQAMTGASGGILAIAGHNRGLVIVMAAAIGVDLPLCWLLIPPLGQIGAAIATSLTMGGSSLCLALVARRLLRVDTTLRAGICQLLESR